MRRGAFLLAALSGARAAPPASGQAPARILPLGDSLTLGVQGQGGGYRAPLGAALKGYGSPFNAGFVGGLYLAGDHSGYSGHTLSGILGAVTQARTMELNDPTHVLLLGGTNDFYFYPPLGANASTAAARMHALLGFLTNRSDPPRIFVATVPPVLEERCAVYSQGPCAPTISANIAAFNSALPGIVAEWKAKAFPIQLVDMGTAGFVPGDYWTAGIHFNDNGWCKMARVWAKALMPTLPKRTAADAASLPLRQQDGAGPFGTFAEPVPQTTRCVIPGSTAEEQPAAPARPEPRPESSAAIAHPEPSACSHTITVDAGSRGSGPSFGEFFGTVSSALGLQSGGAFCAWTSLAPAQLDSERQPGIPRPCSVRICLFCADERVICSGAVGAAWSRGCCRPSARALRPAVPAAAGPRLRAAEGGGAGGGEQQRCFRARHPAQVGDLHDRVR